MRRGWRSSRASRSSSSCSASTCWEMGFATPPIRGFVMSDARELPLAVDGLTTAFRVEGRWYDAIRDVSFSVARNETLALVGESGCGKSITALSIMGLVPKANGRITAGRVLLDGRDLVPLDETEMEKIRGNAISMIFQEPMTSLNPVLPIGFQVAEALRYHLALTGEAARSRPSRSCSSTRCIPIPRRFCPRSRESIATQAI